MGDLLHMLENWARTHLKCEETQYNFTVYFIQKLTFCIAVYFNQRLQRMEKNSQLRFESMAFWSIVLCASNGATDDVRV